MSESEANPPQRLEVPQRALLAFRDALNRGTDKRMLTENGKQHFIYVGGVFLTGIVFRPTTADGSAGFNCEITFDADTDPYLFSARQIAEMLRLFGGHLSAINYVSGNQVHQVTVCLAGTSGFDFD
ncbi:MAG: hypothetical protein ACRETQ_07185 [Gammaproteobacteria bacterium]